MSVLGYSRRFFWRPSMSVVACKQKFVPSALRSTSDPARKRRYGSSMTVPGGEADEITAKADVPRSVAPPYAATPATAPAC